jgi:hypothetical protein
MLLKGMDMYSSVRGKERTKTICLYMSVNVFQMNNNHVCCSVAPTSYSKSEVKKDKRERERAREKKKKS